MAQTTTDLEFDRVTYREGQRLTARDLQDDRARLARLRRLHLRHLHDTWGIAIGFDVQAAGPAAVAVGLGYAIDSAGRDLVLSANVAIPVPAVAGPASFVLVAAFLSDCSFAPASTAAAVCLDAPLHPRRERPGFTWRRADEFEPGLMVPLCHVVVRNGAIDGAVGTRIRRYARRHARPLIASGTTDVPAAWSTPWHAGGFVLIEQRVNTAAAGFSGAPKYFAEIVVTKPSTTESAADTARALAQANGHILEMSADSFVFRALVPGAFTRSASDWAVAWLGVEPLTGCAPSLDLKKLLTAAGLLFRFQ